LPLNLISYFLTTTVLILAAVLLFSVPDLPACTMCTMSGGDTVLVGNNEDWRDPDTYVWFLPPESDFFGRLYFGFGNRFPQGGMNDQGLCFDGFATPYLAVTQSVNLPVYPGNLIDKAMRECSTVDEVVETFSRYNLEGLERAQLMFVDKTVTNLQPNTTYYWKVTAQMNPQFSSESIVKTFTTGNQ
jgi:hypothetical protein